jgi:serine/threonine protein kinase
MLDNSGSHMLGNKYHLLKKIAVGGMAEIFLAEQSGPGGFKKRLVIKRILEHLIGDAKFLQMFQDEARLAAGLNHPNIVQIFELGQENGTYYIAMEYVHGYNLRAVIQNCNEYGMWLAPEYIAKLGSQICEGLEYAHNFCDSDGRHLGIIHRDVSPQNIILSNQGVIKIVDFGIAKATSNKVETQAGVIKGKLAYMSPEQVKGQKLDRRSDIFSLGIVLYELATHKRPFSGKSDLDILRAILENRPTQVTDLRPEFPAELSQIIYRALAKNREERYSSTRDLQWDLERFIQNWGKPIGPFQLQQLVSKLEEITTEPAPPTPQYQQPTPAPAPPPQSSYGQPEYGQSGHDDYSYDDLDEDTIYNPKGHNDYAKQQANSSPYGQNNHSQSSGHQQTPQQNQWFGTDNNEWDEDDGDRTVMNPSPIVSPNDFRPPNRKRQPAATIREENNGNLHPSLQPPPAQIEEYLSQPAPNAGPATLLDANIPNLPVPDYLSGPNAPTAQKPIPVARVREDLSTGRPINMHHGNNSHHGNNGTYNPTPDLAPVKLKPKSQLGKIIGIASFVVICAAAGVAYYLFLN